MNHFSKNLRYLLVKYGVKQSQVAAHIGKGQTSISNWMHGNSEPDVKQLTGISDYFGISLDDLVLRDIEKTLPISNQRIAAFWKKLEQEKGRGRLSKNYSSKNAEALTLEEPAPAYGRAIINQVNEIQLRLDELRKTAEKMMRIKTKE